MAKVVIIGNGAAGNCAAFKLRELDSTLDITMLSQETPPEYSPCALPHYIAGLVPRERLFLKNKAYYKNHNIKLLLGEKATAIDRRRRRVITEKRGIPYGKLILATGSRPIVPRIPGYDKKGVFTLKSVQDADNILAYPCKSAVVIGAGPIGVEASAALRERGVETYLLELEKRVLPRLFDTTASGIIAEELERRGVKVLVGERANEILGDDKVTGVVTDKRRINCDLIILGLGMVPETGLAQQAGVEIGGLRGIKVSPQMATSAANIYACGDCVESVDMVNGWPCLSLRWYDARLQGVTAAYNCAGQARDFAGANPAIAIRFGHFWVFSMGDTVDVLGKDNVEVLEKQYDSTYSRLIFNKDRRLVGAQLIGNTRYSGALFGIARRKYDLSNLGRILGQRGTEVLPLLELYTNYLGCQDQVLDETKG